MINGSARSVRHCWAAARNSPLVPPPVPSSTARGADWKVIAASYNKFPYSFIVKPDIRSPEGFT